MLSGALMMPPHVPFRSGAPGDTGSASPRRRGPQPWVVAAAASVLLLCAGFFALGWGVAKRRIAQRALEQERAQSTAQRPGFEAPGSFRSALRELAREYDCAVSVDSTLPEAELEFVVELGAPTHTLARAATALDTAGRPHDVRVRLEERTLRVERAWVPEGWRCEGSLAGCAAGLERATGLRVLVPRTLRDFHVALRFEAGERLTTVVHDALLRAGLDAYATGSELRINGTLDVSADCDLSRGLLLAGPERRVVRRSTVECLLGRMSALSHRTRAIPVTEGGRIVGVRLLGITPEEPLGLLGFRSDDVLLTVNGLGIADPDRALRAYAAVRTTEELQVVVQRQGRRVELRYVLW